MRLYIPTYRRVGMQKTITALPAELSQYVVLVVHEDERNAHSFHQKLVLPNSLVGIGRVRDYIIQDALEHNDCAIMLDDDLDFAFRRHDDPTKFTPATGQQIIDAMFAIHTKLQAFAMVSMSPREGANRNTGRYLYNTRAIRVLGYDPRTLVRERISFSYMEFMEDFYVQLSLLTRGYPTVHLNWMVHNQPGSNTSGGCSTRRTKDAQRAAAEKLAEHFPQFVTVVEKQTKTSWNGESRHDVRVRWKDAYNAGRQNRAPEVLDSGAEQHPETTDRGSSEAVEP